MTRVRPIKRRHASTNPSYVFKFKYIITKGATRQGLVCVLMFVPGAHTGVDRGDGEAFKLA